jgi:hypothetical protein
MYGATMPPILAMQELAPRPELRTTVGNSSPEKTYSVVNPPPSPILPTNANIVVATGISEMIEHVL